MNGDIHILLVEDNPGDARLLREMISEQSDAASYKVDHRENLTSCLDAVEQAKYSVILLDLGLPDSQGIDTFRRVFRQVRETPIVILSGQSDEQTAFSAVQEGAEDYLPKNELTPSLLSRTLRYAIERHELKQKARFLSTHDPLTKVYNRHYFEQTLVAEVARSKRYKHPIGFLMVDVDRFKEINDSFGHQAGDCVLRSVADYLVDQLRSVDHVVRYGGDEFLVILPETNGGADTVARRFSEAALEIDDVEGTTIQVALSVGGSHWDPASGESIEKALARADVAMYRAKSDRKFPGMSAPADNEES